MGSQPDAGQPAAGEPSPAPVGRPRANFDQLRRDEFIDLIAEGKGIDQALRQLGVSYRAYRNLAAESPEFRDEVASARRSADQLLDEVGYLLAQSNPDVLLEVWKRRDQARLMRDARADRRAERDEDRGDRLRREEAERAERDKDRALRLHLANLAAEARAKELAAKAGDPGKGDATPDLRNLTDAELAEFNRLVAKIAPPPAPAP